MSTQQKPRLHPVPFTPEDGEVELWRETFYWGYRSADFGHYLEICESSDRRDADLMLQLTKMKNSLKSLQATTQRMIDGLTETEKRVLRERFGRNIT